MAFYGYEFIFDGTPCGKYDLMLYDIGSNKQADAVSFTSAGKPIEDRISRRLSSLLYGAENNQSLSFPLVFGASPSRMERNIPFDRFEIEAISSWLTGHDTWKWLKIDQPDLESVRYKCLITELKQISYGNYPWAFSCMVTCDSPYAYKSAHIQTFRCDRITYADMLKAAWLAYGVTPGNPTALDGLTDLGMVNGITGTPDPTKFFLRSDTEGTPFADLPAVKAALEVAVQKIKGYGQNFMDNLKWIELQHLLLPGTSYRAESDLRADINIKYWWEGGAEKPTTIDADAVMSDLTMKITDVYYGYGGYSQSDIDQIFADSLELLHLHKNGTDPDEYVAGDAAAVQAIIQGAIDAAWTYGTYNPDFTTDDTYIYLTWYEIQHFIITGALESEESGNIPTGSYSWKPGATTFSLMSLMGESAAPATTVETAPPVTETDPETGAVIETGAVTRVEAEILFRNRSSYNGTYYPVIEIELIGSPEVEIINHSNRNKSFKFSNIPASVHKITVDNQNGIITTDAGLDVYECFNFNFLGLVRGDNKLTVKGKCVLRFICDFPVNVGG